MLKVFERTVGANQSDFDESARWQNIVIWGQRQTRLRQKGGNEISEYETGSHAPCVHESCLGRCSFSHLTKSITTLPFHFETNTATKIEEITGTSNKHQIKSGSFRFTGFPAVKNHESSATLMDKQSRMFASIDYYTVTGTCSTV